MVRDTGRLLSAFVWGSVATVAGSVLAFKLLPLRSLGADGWKVAAALTARHIGGSVNYVAVSEVLALSPAARWVLLMLLLLVLVVVGNVGRLNELGLAQAGGWVCELLPSCTL